MLQENKRVRSKAPAAFVSLLAPFISKVDEKLQPGLTTLTWSSGHIGKFIDDIYSSLGELEIIVNRVRDVTEFRIERVLKDMANTVLCEIPDDESWTADKFLKNTEVRLMWMFLTKLTLHNN